MSAKANAFSLVERIQAGSTEAETELVQQYWKGLVIMLEQRTNNHASAEDLAQETLIIVLTKLRDGGLHNPGALTSYIHQTAKYVAIGAFRKKDNQIELTDDADSLSPVNGADSTVESLANAQLRRVVLAMLEEVHVERDRELLFRYYVSEQPKPEICEALDLSSDHFDRVLHRARKRCREMADRKYPGVLRRLI